MTMNFWSSWWRSQGFEFDEGLAELHEVAVDELVRLDLLVIDERAVRRMILEDELAALLLDGGVAARHEPVVEDHVARRVLADHGHGLERVQLALVGSFQRDQPAEELLR